MIRGYENSKAQNHAERWGYQFESLGEAPALMTGDFDGDGAVTAADAQGVPVAFTEAVAGGELPMTAAQKAACDIDGSGTIDAGDAQYILVFYTANTVAGTPTAWEDVLHPQG